LDVYTDGGTGTITANPSLSWAVNVDGVTVGSPMITAQPTSQKVIAGDKVTFTAAATADPAATVQWLVSTDQGQTYVPIAGATSTTLSFIAQTSESGKRYEAVFSNTKGSAETNAVTLEVNVPPPVIIGEQAIFRRKLNRKGQPVGKPALQGFALQFSRPMGSGVGDAGNYLLERVASKATYKRPAKLVPVGFTVAYSPSSDTINVNVAGNQAFASGGLLVVSNALASSDGATLSGSKSFSIGKGGKSIGPD
jgi:hypothetical protein